MKKITLLLLVVFNSVLLSAQIDVSITTDIVPLYPEDGDTLSVCRDSMIIFEAEALLSGNPVEDALFSWSFDDGNSAEGMNLDSVTHNYSAGGGYRVKLEVSDGMSNTGYDIAPVKIAHLPIFEGSNNGLPDEQYGICKGSSSVLTGYAYPYLWEDQPVYFIENALPLDFDDTQDYDAAFYFDEFSVTDVFGDGDIDSVCVNTEHARLGDVRAELLCPDGTMMVLKDYSAGNVVVMGEPLENPDEGPGIGYNYCWSAASVNGTMNSFSGDTLPEADYLPDEPFSVLSGCPMNGEWYIHISDNAADEEGYVFSQEIIFSETALPPVWTYRDTLISSSALWLGAGNPATQTQVLEDGGLQGVAVASPTVYGNNGYTFFMLNNWACPADTLVPLPVEAASFTADPAEGQAKLDVTFSGTTDWAVDHYWLPGDGTDILSGLEAVHTYEEDGEYEVIYTAEDESGCTDTDTLTIPVSIEPSDLQVPNFFSPDENGINDILTLTVDGMETFNFVIYTRWGQKIFETDDEEEAEVGWDGKTSVGIKASPGVYFFIFKGEGKDGKEWEEKGTIQLMR